MSAINKEIKDAFESMRIPDIPKSADFQVIDYVDSDVERGLFNGIRQSFDNFMTQFSGTVRPQKYPYNFEQAFVRLQSN